MKNRSKKYRIALFIFSVFILLCCFPVFADDDDYLITYPDGSYGVDLGGGYESLPSGERGIRSSSTPGGNLLLPEGYREDYKDTQYGAMTQRGFINFPAFRFPDARRKEKAAKKRLEEEEKEEKDLIFHEDTTSAGSSIWGVSSPR